MAGRKLRGVATQKDLADLISAAGHSIREGDVSRIETGFTRNPGLDRVAALARALDVTTDYLLGLVDEPGTARSTAEATSVDKTAKALKGLTGALIDDGSGVPPPAPNARLLRDNCPRGRRPGRA